MMMTIPMTMKAYGGDDDDDDDDGGCELDWV